MAKYVLEAVEGSPLVYVKNESTGKVKGQYNSMKEAADAVVALNKHEDSKTALATEAKAQAETVVESAKKSKPKKSVVKKIVDKVKGED